MSNLSILDIIIVAFLAVNCSKVSIEKSDLNEIKNYKCQTK